MENGNAAIDNSWFGQNVSIVRKAGDSNHSDSNAQVFRVPAHPVAPEGVSGGVRRITGVDETVEYKLSSAEEWTAAEGTTLTNLSSGTYQVRIAATDTSFASEPVSVTVRTGSSGGGTTRSP